MAIWFTLGRKIDKANNKFLILKPYHSINLEGWDWIFSSIIISLDVSETGPKSFICLLWDLSFEKPRSLDPFYVVPSIWNGSRLLGQTAGTIEVIYASIIPRNTVVDSRN